MEDVVRVTRNHCVHGVQSCSDFSTVLYILKKCCVDVMMKAYTFTERDLKKVYIYICIYVYIYVYV